MDYPQNSHRFKEEQNKPAVVERKKVEKVVTGVAKTKKRSELGKFFHILATEHAPKIKSYVLNDIFIPAGKKALMGALDMLLNGGTSSNYRSDYSPQAKIRYSKYAEEPNYQKATGTIQARTSFEYEDIAFQTRGAAERVLSTMKDIYAEYRSVTLAEMYELAGLEHPYTYTKYGWESLQGAEIVRRGEDYFIRLPQATLITH